MIPGKISRLAPAARVLACFALLAGSLAAQDSAWEKYRAEGLKAFSERRLDDAEKSFKQALKEAEKFGAGDARLVATLYNLAAVYRRWPEKGEKALAPLERALRIYEKSLGPDDPMVASILEELAEVHLFVPAGKFASGMKAPEDSRNTLDRFALEPSWQSLPAGIHEPTFGPMSTNLPPDDPRNPAKAESLLQRALAIREKAQGPEHADVASCLDRLSYFYTQRSKWAKAAPLQERALAILEKARGADSFLSVVAMNQLGATYLRMGKENLPRAEELFRRALAILEKAAGPDHWSLAPILENLAAVLQKTNRRDEAAQLEARAGAIRAKSGRPKPSK